LGVSKIKDDVSVKRFMKCQMSNSQNQGPA